MSSLPTTLDDLMSACLEEGAYCVKGGRDLYMEVMDTSSGLVWMSAAPVTAEDFSLVLPEGATLRRIELSQPQVVTLPTPTRTFFWFGESMRSFQGPVTLP